MKMDPATLTYNDQGLIPAIVQEAGTGEVLMMAYMNRESLEKTLATGETWFYSRSRQQLWHKGETSGHVQQVKRVQVDCDEDTLLLTVVQTGAACHTGEKSCFYRLLEGAGLPAEGQEAAVSPEMAPIIRQIVATLEERRRVPKEGSYTNYLFDKGIDKILKKVGEEATEIIIAAKNPAKEELIYELSDLVYHVLVLMNERQVAVAEVLKELESRHKK